MKNNESKMNFAAIHPDDVLDIISKLSNTSACGLDEIDTYSIKLVKYIITPALTHIINLSLSSGIFPTIWKSSKIVPLFKKDDPLCPYNYRPVAIIPVLSKVMERAVCNQMVKYLTENELIHPCHHAYRKNHNTTTAIVQMYDFCIQALESDQLIN